MSNSDIEEQIREVYEFNVPSSTISKINGDILDWQKVTFARGGKIF